jgi:hypothetical protein
MYFIYFFSVFCLEGAAKLFYDDSQVHTRMDGAEKQEGACGVEWRGSIVLATIDGLVDLWCTLFLLWHLRTANPCAVGNDMRLACITCHNHSFALLNRDCAFEKGTAIHMDGIWCVRCASLTGNQHYCETAHESQKNN